ncbi:MAG: ABC transporter ATP-binding protein, partial [Actinomycetota bacterium]|nr:ABC transporter ATP-binding protein [Actinomycetota bacterium]
ASGANFLLLDEPTNHLDVESREALEAALDAFPGTLLLVSHDRALVDAVASRTLAIEDGTLRSYDGGWAEYAQRRAEQAEAGATPGRKPERPRPAAPTPTPRGSDPIAELEGRIEAQERALADLEAELAVDWANAEKVAQHRVAREELAALLARWEALVDEVAS